MRTGGNAGINYGAKTPKPTDGGMGTWGCPQIPKWGGPQLGRSTGPRMGVWGGPHHHNPTDGEAIKPTCVSPHVEAPRWGDGEVEILVGSGGGCNVAGIVP